MTPKKPTIDDVAALSGVARTTVSRVLNGGPNVRAEVRDKVMRAVRMLDYKVNIQARSLAGGGSRTIAMVHESDIDAEPNSYYHSGLELGALRACAARGFAFNALGVNPRTPDYVSRVTEPVASGRADGIILTPPFSDDATLLEELGRLGRPVICVSAGPEFREKACSVGIDDEAAGHAIALHLLAAGHRRFGYIDGPEGHRSAAERLGGFRRALAEAGVDGSSLAVLRGNFTFRSGIELAERLLQQDPRPTALACANDDMAAGALLTIHRMKLSIPGEVAVTGFDDTPVSEIVWPPLTTIHQPIRRMGEQAVGLLADALAAGNGGVEPGFHPVAYRLVTRESTGSVPA